MHKPGISREDRLSDEGLQRLRRQLESGNRLSQPVLQQWVRRYGQPAIELIEQFNTGNSGEDQAYSSKPVLGSGTDSSTD